MGLFHKKNHQERRKSFLIGENLTFEATEAYNTIRTNLALSIPGKKMGKVIGVTSSVPCEGKSYNAINLAFALAKNGSSVLLIGADLRKPSLEVKLGIEKHKGLSNVLCGECTFQETAVKGILLNNLTLLSSGDIPPNPTELLGSQALKEFIKQVENDYEYIVFDLPPLNTVIDAVLLKEYVDGFIIIIRHNYTQKKYVRKAMAQLEYAKIRVIGFIANYSNTFQNKYYRSHYYKHGYGYYMSEEKEGNKDGNNE